MSKCLGRDISVRQHSKSEHWAPCHIQTPSRYDWKRLKATLSPNQTKIFEIYILSHWYYAYEKAHGIGCTPARSSQSQLESNSLLSSPLAATLSHWNLHWTAYVPTFIGILVEQLTCRQHLMESSLSSPLAGIIYWNHCRAAHLQPTLSYWNRYWTAYLQSTFTGITVEQPTCSKHFLLESVLNSLLAVHIYWNLCWAAHLQPSYQDIYWVAHLQPAFIRIFVEESACSKHFWIFVEQPICSQHSLKFVSPITANIYFFFNLCWAASLEPTFFGILFEKSTCSQYLMESLLSSPLAANIFLNPCWAAHLQPTFTGMFVEQPTCSQHLLMESLFSNPLAGNIN